MIIFVGRFILQDRDAVVALFGVDYGQSSFGYSYDITTSTIRIPSVGLIH